MFIRIDAYFTSLAAGGETTSFLQLQENHLVCTSLKVDLTPVPGTPKQTTPTGGQTAFLASSWG